MKIVTASEMRQLEQRAEAAGISTQQLMENAGLATAQEAWMLLGAVEGRSVLVLVGPGNNGGDGLVAARHLADWGAATSVYLTRPRDNDDNLRQVRSRSIEVSEADSDADQTLLDRALTQADLVVDALLGTGRARPIEGVLATILDRLADARKSLHRPGLLAVDLPTGVDADTGAVDPHTVAADETITFAAAKVGLCTLPGSSFAGRVETVDIGVPPEALEALPLTLLTAAWARERLPARPLDANKGTFGKLLTVTGSENYVGAAFLSAAGAYRIGAGLVTVALPRSIQSMVAPLIPEATFLPLQEDAGGIVTDNLPLLRRTLSDYDALLVGCGLSQRAYTQQFVRSFLYGLLEDEQQGVVVDADGLNALAAHADWYQRFRAPAILTPHPGEFARLAGLSVTAVQADRIALSIRCARLWNKIVVLKGANTVIATPEGRAMISPFANPALATAGTGDVLAGTIAGLLAQAATPAEAAALGVYLHGAAGELMAGESGDAGGLAGDLLPLLPRARQALLHPH
jgi:hydroxyethylthiazole kinase-like uncharacterized protein yjeF